MAKSNWRNRNVRAYNRGTPERLPVRSLGRSGFVHKVPTGRSMWSSATHYSGAAYRTIRNIICGATRYTLLVLGAPFRLALKPLTWEIGSFKRNSDIENQQEECHETCIKDLTRSQKIAHQREVERLKTTLRNEKEKFQEKLLASEEKLDAEIRKNTRLEEENRTKLISFERIEAENLELDKQWQIKFQNLDDRHQREIDGFQRRYDDLREKLEAERKANQELSTRLSKVMSNKLTDNNPNIADLSDENRPTKLVEKLSELYDNEWTNAYGVLEDQYAGYGVVCILLNIFQDCFNQCRNLATEQLTSAKDHIMNFSPEDQKQFKDERKRNVFMTLPFVTHLLKIFFETKRSKELPPDLLQSNGMLQDYIHRCTEVSWLMAIQDPPMAISRDVPRTLIFNKSYFKEYTKSGKFVDYVVWPAILIQDGGALMAKGIVQCCDRFEDSKLRVKELA